MHFLYEHIQNNLKFNEKYYVGIILIIKLFIGLYYFSSPAENWYIPFMESITNSAMESFNNLFKYDVGSNIAFPYGYGLIIFFIPSFFLSYFLNFDPNIAYFITLAFADISIYFFIKKIVIKKSLNVFIYYWCNPLLIVSTYYLGLNDIIPVLFVVIAVYFIKSGNVLITSLSISFAISCKMSMILAFPLFIIYFHHNKQIRQHFWSFLILSILFIFILEMPHLLTVYAREMLFYNPNALETIFLKIGKIGNNNILILPVLYSLLMLVIWHMNRLNFGLLINLIAIMFIAISFVSNTSPGWFIWGIPFLAFFNAYFTLKDKVLIYVFYFITVCNTLILGPIGLYEDYFFAPDFPRFEAIKPYEDIVYSVFFSIGLVLCIRLWILGINSNDYYKYWRKPLVIGVTGNSGVGKTTFTNSLEKVLGKESITHIKGDSYHNWDRNKTIWNTITHLNPRANELSKLNFDIQKLVSGKSIKTSYYDHRAGKKFLDNYKNSNNFIIIEGLHVLSLPMMREQCDVKIFLDFEEKLRQKLKISRDIKKRGYKEKEVVKAIERRKIDETKYIQTQKQFADIIIKISSTPNYWIENKNERFILEIIAKQPLYFDMLAKFLVYKCKLGVEMYYGEENKIIINGVPSAHDIEAAAKKLVFNYDDILSITPKWMGGIKGIVQLLGMIHISYAFRLRVI